MDEKPKVQDLGWGNSWTETPDIVKKCKAAGHKTTDRSLSPTGFTGEVRCDICGYVYKYDSS